MAAREVIADLHADGRGGVSRNVDRTRLSVRFVAGRRPASDSDRELVDMWEAGAEVGDVGSIRVMGLLYQHGVRCVPSCVFINCCNCCCVRVKRLCFVDRPFVSAPPLYASMSRLFFFVKLAPPLLPGRQKAVVFLARGFSIPTGV